MMQELFLISVCHSAKDITQRLCLKRKKEVLYCLPSTVYS